MIFLAEGGIGLRENLIETIWNHLKPFETIETTDFSTENLIETIWNPSSIGDLTWFYYESHGDLLGVVMEAKLVAVDFTTLTDGSMGFFHDV